MSEQKDNQTSGFLDKNCTDKLTSDNLINSILQQFETSTSINGQDVSVSVSVNINYQDNKQKEIIEVKSENIVDSQQPPVIEVKSFPVEDYKTQVKNSIAEDNSLHLLINLIKFLIKLAIWGVITRSWLESNSVNEVETLLFFSWIVGLIYPSAVIKFGLPNNRQTVSKIYTTLMAVALGFDSSFINKQDFEDYNSLQIWVIGFSSAIIGFNLLYPEGTILKNTEESNRFQLGCGCMLLAIILVGIIGGLKAVFQ